MRWGRIAAILAGTIPALVLAEAWARSREGGVEWIASERLYRTAPGLHGTNASGFHDEEWPAERGTARRIAVLGDSMTWGTGSAAETWPAVMEDELGPTWDVFNLSGYGYDTRQEVSLLPEAWELDPDALLVGIYWNDAIPTRVVQMGSPPSPVWLENRSLPWFHSALFRFAHGRVHARGYQGAPEAGFVFQQLARMKSQADFRGVPMLSVLLWPHAMAEGIAECARLSQKALDCARARTTSWTIADEARAIGLTVIDTLPLLVEPSFPANPGDWEHPGPAADARIGRGLAPLVQEQLVAYEQLRR